MKKVVLTSAVPVKWNLPALSPFRYLKFFCFVYAQVRYESRKKLAEQRPRVRGQFVKMDANGAVDKVGIIWLQLRGMDWRFKGEHPTVP